MRKKYGFSGDNLKIFYHKDKGRFHSFGVLIEKLEEKIQDFHGTPLKKVTIRKIDKYRQQGNAGAHTIELNLSRDTILQKVKEVEFLAKLLIRILNLL